VWVGHNRSTTAQIFCIHQILEKTEYNETILHQFTDVKKAYNSVRREVLYIIGVSMKVVRLIKCV
jgi:DNA-binding FrmR family transcriptional regulator